MDPGTLGRLHETELLGLKISGSCGVMVRRRQKQKINLSLTRGDSCRNLAVLASRLGLYLSCVDGFPVFDSRDGSGMTRNRQGRPAFRCPLANKTLTSSSNTKLPLPLSRETPAH